MPIIVQSSQWFFIKNPLYKIGQFTKETDTGITKQGTWDGVSRKRVYYNDLPATILNTVGNVPISTGAIPPSGTNGTSQLMDAPTTGAIDSSNTIFTWAHSPYQLVLNGQTLKLGTDYTQSGITTTLTTAPFTGDSLWAYGNF